MVTDYLSVTVTILTLTGIAWVIGLSAIVVLWYIAHKIS